MGIATGAGSTRNGNILCSVCIDTTGDNPKEHDLISIAVVPLDRTFDRDKKYNPFLTTLQPINTYAKMDILHAGEYKLTHRHSAKQPEYKNAMTYGAEYTTLADAFEEWFDKLGLKERKRIIPLAYDWPFVSMYLKKWLSIPAYERIFDYRYRDLLSCCTMENDNAEYNFRELPFRKLDFSYIGSTLGMAENAVLQLPVAERALVLGKMYLAFHHRRNTWR